MSRQAPVTALLLVIAAGTWLGCESEDPSKFIGSWVYGSGAVKATCGSLTPSFDLAQTSLAITEHDGALEAESGGCRITLELRGSSARGRGQTCTLTNKEIQANSTGDWGFTTTDGTTMKNKASGTAVLLLPGALPPIVCTHFELSGNLVRSDGSPGSSPSSGKP
jgi:hypothetical protein